MQRFLRSRTTAILSGLLCFFGTIVVFMEFGSRWHDNAEHLFSHPFLYVIPALVGLALPSTLARTLRDGDESRQEIGAASAQFLRWLLLYPLLFVGGCHTLMTGSPIPLWYIERLDVPVQVKSINEEHLVL